MRVAICSDFYPPQLSGISDSVAGLAGELRARGHTVRTYAARAGAGSEADVVRLPSVELSGSSGSMPLVIPVGAKSDLRRFQPDIIHTHTFGGVGVAARHAALSLGVPLVGTDHTLPAHYLHYVKLDFRGARYLVRRFAAWYYQGCAVVTAPSQTMLNELTAHGLGRPGRVISNHIAADVFRPLETRLELKKKMGVGPRALLLFGRVAVEKNWQLACDIFADVAAKSDAELVVIGDGPARGRLEEAVGDYGLADRCHFLGVLRGETLVEAINACDVFLITSKSETQSMTMLQASACGLPVVAVRAGALPEYVQDGITGFLVDSDDRATFVDRVVALLEDQELAGRVGRAGRKYVLQFALDRIVDQFEAVYATALSRHHKLEARLA